MVIKSSIGAWLNVMVTQRPDCIRRYEMIAWIPNVIAFIIMAAVGGKHLASVPIASEYPASTASILSFASALAVTVIAWSTISPDYGVFHDAKGSR